METTGTSKLLFLYPRFDPQEGSVSIGPQCPYHVMQETANCGGPSSEAAKTEVLCRYRFSTISPLPAQRQYPRTRS